MDYKLADVTVEQFRRALRDAVEQIGVVEPEALREPIAWWLRGINEMAARQRWMDLVGRDVGAAWNTAQAILAEAEALAREVGLRCSGGEHVIPHRGCILR